MCQRSSLFRLLFLAAILLGAAALPAQAAIDTFRIAAYNVEADTVGIDNPGVDTYNPGLPIIIEAMGEQKLNNVQQPVDIVGMEETTSNTATVEPVVNILNSYYGGSLSNPAKPYYTYPSYQATTNDGTVDGGNGPNALAYNENTLVLISATGCAHTPDSSGGSYRQVLRCAFEPVGGTSANIFYVYVAHSKSGSSSTDMSDRATEATEIRNDEATLPANTPVLYMGDFNLNGSTESMYATLTASGQGQAIDPQNVNPQNNNQTWDTSAYASIETENDTKLEYRDDFQFQSAPVYSGTLAAGLRAISGNYRVFGNNGTTTFEGPTNTGTNSSLNNLQQLGSYTFITSGSALYEFQYASDHLPIVADYTIATLYNAWQNTWFTSTQLTNSAITGDTANPSGDGISNLMKYALNLNPNLPATSGLPVSGQIAVSSTSYLTLTYNQVITASDVTYIPQVSSDLVNWYSGSGYTTQVSATPNGDGVTETVVVRDDVAISGTTARFMRLKVAGP